MPNYLKIELNQQSVQGSESVYVNKLVKVELSKKKRQRKCTVDGGRVLHIYKSSFLHFCDQILCESSVDEVESDKAQTQPFSSAL